MTTTAAQTSALKFRDMILSKFAHTTNTNVSSPATSPPSSDHHHQEAMATEVTNSNISAPAKSRLSFSVDSLLKKKVSHQDDPEDIIEDEDEVLDEDEDIEDEEELPEDLSSNNNEVVKHDQDSSPKLAMPTPILPNTMAALAASMSRPHPHFLAAGIAAMAAAAAAANNSQAVTSSTTATTSASLPFTTNGGASPWPPTPPGHPGPPLGFPFGIPGLRHPLFSTGMSGMLCLVSVLIKKTCNHVNGQHSFMDLS